MPPRRKAQPKSKVPIEQVQVPDDDTEEDIPIKNRQKSKRTAKIENEVKGVKDLIEKPPDEQEPSIIAANVSRRKNKGSKTAPVNQTAKKEETDLPSQLDEGVTGKKQRKVREEKKVKEAEVESDEDVPVKKQRKAKEEKKVKEDVDLAAQSDEDVPVKKQRKAKEGKKTQFYNENVDDNEAVETISASTSKATPMCATPVTSVKRLRGTKAKKEEVDLASQPDEDVPVRKQRKAKEGKQAKKEEVDSETQLDEDVPVKKQRKAKEGKEDKEDKSKKNEKQAIDKPKNVTITKWETLDFGCDKKNAEGKNHNLKITSWNVDGLRAWVKKDGLNILNYDKPDIFCLQETKCSEEKLPDEVIDIDGYHDYWCSSTREGYAGIGVYSKVEPINVTYGIGEEKHDDEGRCITLEYSKFYLVNVYVPNAGRRLVTLPKRLEWNELFKAYIKDLDKKKPVIVCGDMNVAHNEIDLTNPKNNRKNAGFTQEERDGMTDFLEDGYIDSFRELYPDKKDVYTFWSYISNARSKNIGWRLDYFIISSRIMEKVCENVVRNEVYGSDHCPITLFINI